MVQIDSRTNIYPKIGQNCKQQYRIKMHGSNWFKDQHLS